MPQRSSWRQGTWQRTSRHGRTGHDATLLLSAGTAGFGFRSGEVWAVHVSWSGDQSAYAERTPEGESLLGGGELLVPGEVALGAGETYESPWLVGAWGFADIGDGSFGEVVVATVVPAAILGVRFGLAPEPDAQKRRRIDQRSRSWIFVTPALAFIVVGLLGPLIRTIYLSFHNRNGTEYIGDDNYYEIFTNKNSVNFDNWENIFTSRLFYLALALLALQPLVGLVVIGSAVRVHPLDVDDVELARAAVDLISLALHGSDDEMG